MSVINQMLKDLDERKTASQSTAYEPMMNQKAQSSKLPWIIVGLLSVLLISWALKDILFNSTDSAQSTSVATDTTESIKTPAQTISDQSSSPVAKKAITAKETITQDEPVTQASTQVPEEKIVEGKQIVATEENLAVTTPPADIATKDKPIETRIEDKVSTLEDSAPRVVKVSPQQELRAKAETLYEKYQKANFGTLNEAQYSEILELDPTFHKVRISWFSQLSQQKDNRFESLSANAIQRWPAVYHYRQMLARSWVMNEPEKAYQLLMQQPPAIEQAPDYHGLIAYSAKQMGDFNLASKQYQLLLKSYPERADWWLALALAEEQQQRTTSALRAYQQSLRFPGLADNIQAYAEQRIKALQGF